MKAYNIDTESWEAFADDRTLWKQQVLQGLKRVEAAFQEKMMKDGPGGQPNISRTTKIHIKHLSLHVMDAAEIANQGLASTATQDDAHQQALRVLLHSRPTDGWHYICTHKNNIPVNIPSHPYLLLNRSILYSCDLEAESNFLLESLAGCQEHEKPDLEMYFTVNLAFVNYLDQLNEMIDTPIVRNWTNQKQIPPISLEPFEINSSLLQAPKTLREFVSQYKENRKMMNNQKGKTSDKNSKTFVSSFFADVLVFAAALLTVVIMFIIIYILSGQPKLKTLVANITLQRVKAIEEINPKNQSTQD